MVRRKFERFLYQALPRTKQRLPAIMDCDNLVLMQIRRPAGQKDWGVR